MCELDLSLLASSALTNGKVNICVLPYRGLPKGLWFLSNLWPYPAPVPTLGSIYVLWTSKARLPLSTTVCAPWSVPSELPKERPMLSLMGIGQVSGPRATVELDWSPLTSCCVALPGITLRLPVTRTFQSRAVFVLESVRLADIWLICELGPAVTDTQSRQQGWGGGWEGACVEPAVPCAGQKGSLCPICALR